MHYTCNSKVDWEKTSFWWATTIFQGTSSTILVFSFFLKDLKMDQESKGYSCFAYDEDFTH